MALQEVAALLRCPSCGTDLVVQGQVLRCGHGHSFDIARHGHVTLLDGTRGADTGDSRAMVQARQAFLRRGHFSRIAEAVAAEVADAVAGVDAPAIVDVGAGTGYYLAAALVAAPRAAGLALDLSPAALRAAARAHGRIGAVGCDVWRGLPVRSGAATVLLNVFAPRNGAEMARVLQPDGALVVVTPRAPHLSEVVEPLGLVQVAPDKARRLAGALEGFCLEQVTEVTYTSELDERSLHDVVAMGPSARHADVTSLEAQLAAMAPLTVTVSVDVGRYRR